MSIESSLRGKTTFHTDSSPITTAAPSDLQQPSTPSTSPLSPRKVVQLDKPLPDQPAKVEEVVDPRIQQLKGGEDSASSSPILSRNRSSTVVDRTIQQLKEGEDSASSSPILSRKRSSTVVDRSIQQLKGGEDSAPTSPIMGRKRASVTLSGTALFTKATSGASASSSSSESSPVVSTKRESPRPLPTARVIVAHEELVIPDNAANVLSTWYAGEGWKDALKPEEKADPATVKAQQNERNQNLSSLKGCSMDANGNRVPSDVQIKACHIRFKDDFQGSWAVMKETCKDKGLMQVINDTRAAELKLCLVDILKDFDILNCGSTKLTSDCDFALMSRDQNQTDEAKGVARFNDIFQARWGRSSAFTFDSNAYTMQYSMKCSDLNNEGIRGTQQLKFSRVMANRLSDPESIKRRNEAVLNAAEPAQRDLLAKSLEGAVKKAEWAELKVKQGMISHLVQDAKLEDQAKLPSKEGALKVVKGFTYFEAGAQDKEKIRKAYLSIVEAAFKENPAELDNLRVKVENDIHLALKGGPRIQNLQVAMVEGQRAIDSLRQAPTGAEFVAIHNDALKNTMEYCAKALKDTEDPEEVRMLQAQIEGLKAKQLAPEQGDKALEAFKAYDGAANARASALESLNVLTPKYTRLAALVESKKEDVKTKNAVEKLRTEVCKLLHIQNVDISVVLFQCKEKIASFEKKRPGLDAAVEAVEDKYGFMLAKAIAVVDAKDQMVIRYQNAQLEGMLFAQEAHVGEGAFDYTVRDLQKGDHDNRTLNQMVQHFNEVSAFFKAHQEHVREGSGPEAKLVEASKYGLRLVSNIQTTTVRAESLGVKLPAIDQAGLQKFAQLMTALGAIRGTGKTDDEVLQATKTAVGAYRGEDPAGVQNQHIGETLTQVNGFVEALSATMDAWIEGSAVAALRDRYV